MTNRGVSDFIGATANDKALQAEWNGAETPGELVGVGKRHGYDFDAQELQAALATMQRLQGEELGDKDLEEVAGGLSLAQSLSTTLPRTGFQFYEGWPCKWTVPTTDFGR